MKRFWLIWVCLFPINRLHLQGVDGVTAQCSSIRELVYTGWYHEFSDIMGKQLSSSSGFGEAPNWHFTNTKYDVELTWPGSSKSFISDYNEQTDSSHVQTRQYIAEMGFQPDYKDALKLLRQLNLQIEGCPYMQGDSLKSSFRPLPNDSLPLNCPSELQQANLYELPLRDTVANEQHEFSIMTGIEKYRAGYRVSLIVEDMRLKKKQPVKQPAQ